jgi:hypothetical protein
MGSREEGLMSQWLDRSTQLLPVAEPLQKPRALSLDDSVATRCQDSALEPSIKQAAKISLLYENTLERNLI